MRQDRDRAGPPNLQEHPPAPAKLRALGPFDVRRTFAVGKGLQCRSEDLEEAVHGETKRSLREVQVNGYTVKSMETQSNQ